MDTRMTTGPIGTVRTQREKKGEAAQKVLKWLMLASVGALLQSVTLTFEVRPFAVALAAASTGAFFSATVLGASMFALLTADYLSIVTLALLGVVRVIASLMVRNKEKREAPVFEEPVRFRVITCALTMLAMGIYTLCRGNLRYYYLLALFVGVVIAPLASAALTGLFSDEEEHSRGWEIGFATLLFLCVFAMRTVSFAGISPAATAVVFASFWLAAHRGIWYGTIGGGLLGLAYGVPFAPVFALCGLGFGVLEKSRRGAAILLGAGLGALWSFLVLGVPRSVLLLPALLTAGALFLVGDSAGLVEGNAKRLSVWRRRSAEQTAGNMALEWQQQRMRALGESFTDLSDVLAQLGSKGRRPGTAELRHLCDRAFDRTCPTCEHRALCWGSEYVGTTESLTRMAERLRAGERADYTQLDEPLVSRCLFLDSILAEINESAQELCEEALRGDKLSVIATDYAAISRVLCETLEGSRISHSVDKELGEQIEMRLRRAGYTFDGVCVCGKAHRRILLRGLRLRGRRIKPRELRALLEKECGFALGEAEMRENNGIPDILYRERAKFVASSVKCTKAKGEDGASCGDSTFVFDADEAYSYAFLCDGMGSGNSAALTSALSGRVLSCLLRGGNGAPTSLRMLCSVLEARGRRQNEASATVDLLEIDRVRGEAALFKCGAAPTYLLREGQITRFFSRTAPIGILGEPDMERLGFSLQNGDVIVQVSDGVTEGEEDCPWLADMLLARYEGDAQQFAKQVLTHAATGEHDDLSVIVTEIKNAAFVPQ